MKTLVSLKNVSFSYHRVPVVKALSFDIREQDFIGMIGPNGGGKTTIVKLITGELKPQKGEIHYHCNDSGKKSGQIGYLPQINHLDKQFPVQVNELVLSGFVKRDNFLKRYSKEQKYQVNELMNEMGIGHLKDRAIGDLSGGQLQRALLCRAVVSMPRVLLLDEPNTFVDNKFEQLLYEKLKKWNEQMAVVLVSHDIGMISSYVKTIACVNETLHMHYSNKISQEQLDNYNCPLKLVTHGHVPHTVLEQHDESN